jgi:ubiquinone/menaquinone biosynthesis C-methylase UbiE
MSHHEPSAGTHGHQHHGHEHDRGAAALLRYLRLLPVMWRSEVSDEVVRLIAPQVGERVIDLGAGMGPATVEAARLGATVLAVDPTPFMRWILKLRRSWQPRRASVSVLDGAAEAIPAEAATVDAVWTVNTLHHWTDPTLASHELARILRPGGRALLMDEDFDDPTHPWHAQWRAAQKRRGPDHFDVVDVEALAHKLLAAGFATAVGSRTSIAGRPAKMVRATR